MVLIQGGYAIVEYAMRVSISVNNGLMIRHYIPTINTVIASVGYEIYRVWKLFQCQNHPLSVHKNIEYGLPLLVLLYQFKD